MLWGLVAYDASLWRAEASAGTNSGRFAVADLATATTLFETETDERARCLPETRADDGLAERPVHLGRE
jgi:hypothetical protein